MERLKETADGLRRGTPESELQAALLADFPADTVQQLLDVAVRYNDLMYRRTGLKFFFLGLGFLVLGILFILLSMFVFPLSVWPQYALVACVVAAGVNLMLGFYRTVLHKNPRANAAIERMGETDDA